MLLSQRFVSIVVIATILLFATEGLSQCKLIDQERGAAYITFEKTAMVKLDGKAEPAKGVVLQLHNNSSCSILVTTGTAEGLYKPLPSNPAPIQRIKREIDYVLPDGVLAPSMQYWFQTRRAVGMSVGGDMFFQFEVRGGRFVRFEVPFIHLDPTFASKLELEFDYLWETSNYSQPNSSGVRNTIVFWIESLPKAIREEIKRAS